MTNKYIIEDFDFKHLLVDFPKYEILNNFYDIDKSFIYKNVKITNKYGFINFCLENLDYIKTFSLDFQSHTLNKLNTVFIEFRKYPHMEYIIRNNMLKLKSKSSYTFVCGNDNYDLIKSFNIENLKIIKLDINNISRGKYSKLLASKDFWEYFTEEYILINQWDSIIFNDNIEDFFGYDFIGAPFAKPNHPKQFFQGNGGFSLRKRQRMLDIIETIDIKKMPNKMKPLKFMQPQDENICPEDVYFNQYLIRDRETKIPSFELCVNFSMESFKSDKPFGGHNFFSKKWDSLLEYKTQIIYEYSVKSNFQICKIPELRELIIFNNNTILKSKHSHSPEGEEFINKLNIIDKSFINSKKKCYFEKVLVLNKRYDFNWRHFLTETFYDLASGYNKKDVTILLNENAPKYIIDLLGIFNITNFYLIKDDVVVNTKEVLIPRKSKKLKEIFLQNLIYRCHKLSEIKDINYYDKLYLMRKNDNENYRFVLNQDLLDEKIKELDYYGFEGGTIPLYQQISLINKAKNIITQIGANCDNIIFCNEKANFKIIYPFNCKKWARMYYEYKQCELLYCGNIYIDNENDDKYNWNYEIDFNLLNL